MFLWLEPKEKNYMFGLMRLSDIFRLQEWAARGKEWEPYWKDQDTKLVHFIGKDNIVFHCVIFPAMLKAEGSYILPDNVPARVLELRRKQIIDI
jgi:methionyl-tRNA synthetase